MLADILGEQVRIRTFTEFEPEKVVKNLASIEGPVDVYCWYEGRRGLLETCTKFMKDSFFEPIFKAKKDAKLWLYSLRGWQFKDYTLLKMPDSTPIGEVINRVNRTAFECIYSFSFFRFCVQAAKDNELYAFVMEELPKKEWLINLSKEFGFAFIDVSTYFDNQSSLFDCFKEWDVQIAYSCMQYMEGYYLIQESVKRALSSGDKKIEVAFLLPRGEEEYYKENFYSEFRSDIERMLSLQFKEALTGIEVTISFLIFKFGNGTSKPYYNTWSRLIREKEISSLFKNLGDTK